MRAGRGIDRRSLGRWALNGAAGAALGFIEIDALLARLALPAKVGAELRAIRGALIDVDYRGAQLWPSGLHEKLNALFDTVDSGDYAPSRQAREVFALLSGQLDRLTRRWQAARGKVRR